MQSHLQTSPPIHLKSNNFPNKIAKNNYNQPLNDFLVINYGIPSQDAARGTYSLIGGIETALLAVFSEGNTTLTFETNVKT